MDKGVLTLKGERSAETRSEDGKFTRVERVHGSFHRRFALPDTADDDIALVVGFGSEELVEQLLHAALETTKLGLGVVADRAHGVSP